MNFLGHCVVATWKSEEPRFWLGAMMPDFASILGTKWRVDLEFTVAEGVRFHQETDRVFHNGKWFLEFQRSAREHLGRVGVSRGARLALAHIGPELMLDGTLYRSARHRNALARALESADAEFIASNLRVGPDGVQRARAFEELRARLLSTRPVATTEAELVTRLVRILDHRPKLRLAEQDVPRVRAWIGEVWPQVHAAEGAWLAEIRAGLS